MNKAEYFLRFILGNGWCRLPQTFATVGDAVDAARHCGSGWEIYKVNTRGRFITVRSSMDAR